MQRSRVRTPRTKVETKQNQMNNKKLFYVPGILAVFRFIGVSGKGYKLFDVQNNSVFSVSRQDIRAFGRARMIRPF